MGPSPNFDSWPYGTACYVTWPGGYIDGMNAREHYEKECDRIPGHIHFEGDYGSNHNTCIFSPPSSGSAEGETESSSPSRPREPELDAMQSFGHGRYETARKQFMDALSYWGEMVGSDDKDVARRGELRSDFANCMIYVSMQMDRNSQDRKITSDDMALVDKQCVGSKAMAYSFAREALERLRQIYRSQQPEEPVVQPELAALPEWREKFPDKGYCENEVSSNRGQPYVGHCSAVLIASIENYSGFNPGFWDEKGDPDWKMLKTYWRTGRQFYLYTDRCDVGSDEMAARSKAHIVATTRLEKMSRAWDQELKRGKFRPSLGVKGDRIISHCYAYKGPDTSLPSGENPD